MKKKQKLSFLFAPYFVPALLLLAGVGFWFVLANFVNPELNLASDMWTYICYGAIVLVAVLAGLSVIQVRAQGMAALRVANIPLAVLYFLAAAVGFAYGGVHIASGLAPLSIYNILQGLLFMGYGIWMALIGVLFCTQKKPSPTKSPILGFWAVMPFCVQAAMRVLRTPASLFRLLPTVKLLAALLAVLWLSTLVRGFYIALRRRRMKVLYVEGFILFLLAFCLEMAAGVSAVIGGTFELMPLLESVNMGALGLAACGTSMWIAACSRKDMLGRPQVEDMLMEEGPIELVERAAKEELPQDKPHAKDDAKPLDEPGVKLPLVAAGSKGDFPTLVLPVQDILAQGTLGDSPTMVLDARLLRGDLPEEAEEPPLPEASAKQKPETPVQQEPQYLPHAEERTGNHFKGELLTPAPAATPAEGTAKPFVAQKLTPASPEEMSALGEQAGFGSSDFPEPSMHPISMFDFEEEAMPSAQSQQRSANLFEEAVSSLAQSNEAPPLPRHTSSLMEETPMTMPQPMYTPAGPSEYNNMYAPPAKEFLSATGNLFDEGAPAYIPIQEPPRPEANLFEELSSDWGQGAPEEVSVDLFDESVLDPGESPFPQINMDKTPVKEAPSVFDKSPPATSPMPTMPIQSEAEEDMWDSTIILDAIDPLEETPAAMQAEPVAPAAHLFDEPAAAPYQYEAPAAMQAEPVAPAANLFDEPAAAPYQYEAPAATQAEPVAPAANLFDEPAAAPYQYEAPVEMQAEPVAPAAHLFDEPAAAPYQYETPAAMQAEPVAPAANLFDEPAAAPYQYETPAAMQAEPVAPAAHLFDEPAAAPYQYETPAAMQAEPVAPAANLFDEPAAAPYQYEAPAAMQAEPVAPAANLFDEPAAAPYQYEAPAAMQAEPVAPAAAPYQYEAPAEMQAEPVAPAAHLFDEPAAAPYQYETPAAMQAEPVAPAAHLFDEPAAAPYQYETPAAMQAEPVAPAANLFDGPAAAPYQYETPAAMQAEPVAPAANLFDEPAAAPYQYETPAAMQTGDNYPDATTLLPDEEPMMQDPDFPPMMHSNLYDSGNMTPYEGQRQAAPPMYATEPAETQPPAPSAVHYDGRPQPSGQLYGEMPTQQPVAPPKREQESAALGRTMNMAVEEILAELKSSSQLPTLDSSSSAPPEPRQPAESKKTIFKRKF